MNWEIIEKIASGTFGTVFKVKNKTTGQIASFKKIHRNFTTQKDKNRIRRGFWSASKVNHTNCVQMIEWVENEKEFGFIMEFVNGSPISEIKKSGLTQILQTIIQVCNGLDALHKKHIFHRDLKPENILITEENKVKITDFDLVKFEDSTSLTNEGTFVGTVKYSSPEQCKDSNHVDQRSDLYSLGVIFYELVTGNVPFDGNNFTNIALSHLRSPIISPRQFSPELPPQIEKIIQKLLEKSPKDRYQTAREVALELNTFLSGSEEIEIEEIGDYLLPPVFVGREIEFRKLENHFTNTLNNESKTVFIKGESGLGKSKLWEEFRIGIRLQNAFILESHCPKETNIFHSLQTILTKAFEPIRNISDRQKSKIVGRLGWDLVKILPEFSEMDFMEFIEQIPSLNGQAGEIRLFDAIVNFLTNLSNFKKSPIVIFIDDLQWADESICHFLLYASRAKVKSQVLFMGAFREEELIGSRFEPFLSQLLQDELAEEIKLSPLSKKETGEMISSMLGGQDSIEDSFLDKIYENTNGNPFFLQEILSHLLEKSELSKTFGVWKFSESLSNGLEIPGSVSKVISERLELLPKENFEILQICSVIGNSFEIETLHKAFKIELEKIFSVLEDALEQRIVERKRGNGNYVFVHNLFKEMLETELEKANFQKLHKQIGEFLERETGNIKDKVEVLATHFYNSSDKKKAIKYLQKASQKAENNYENLLALDFYEKTLSLLDETFADTKIKIDALIGKGQILQLIGKINLAKEHFSEAKNLAEKIEDKEKQAQLNRVLGWIFYSKGDFSNAENHFKKALNSYKELEHKHGIAGSLGNFGQLCKAKGELAKANEYFEKVKKYYSELKNDLGLANSFGQIGNIFAQRNEFSKAIENYEKHLKLSEKIKDKNGISIAKGNLGSVFTKEGKLEKAMQCFAEQQKISEELGYKRGILLAIGNIGGIYQTKGNYEKALEFYQKQLELSDSLGDKRISCQIFGNLAQISEFKKETKKAIEFYEKAIELSKELNFGYFLCQFLQEIAALYLKSNRFEKASTTVKEALKTARKFSRNDIVFKSKILDFKLRFLLNPNLKAEFTNFLTESLTTAKEQTEFAILYEELWEITGTIAYFQKADFTYSELYHTTKNYEFAQKAKELKMPISKGKDDTKNLIGSLVKWLSPETAFGELLNFLIERCKADSCQIILKDSETDNFRVKISSQNLPEDEVDFSKGILEKAIVKDEPFCIENAVESPDFQNNKSVADKNFLSVIAVPIKRVKQLNEEEPKPFGAIYLDRKSIKNGSFVQSDVSQVKQLAEILTPILLHQEESEKIRLQSEVKNLGFFIGTSTKMREIYEEIEEVANVDFTVFVSGETGTGKELTAKAIHQLSNRRNKPFIVLNCSTIPKNLAESEFFGHEKGSFSGAFGLQKGKFELAQGGTIFLDEIGEMPLDIQVKLLRVIQEREFWRVGGNRAIPLDVRIIVATHKNLAEEVEKGNFREDLFHRLNVLNLEVPPLRVRGNDVVQFAYYFLEKYSKELGKKNLDFSEEAISAMSVYEWSGNVRELENTIARVVVKHKGSNKISAKEIFGDKLKEINFDTKPKNKEVEFLYKRVIESGSSFWDVIAEPFLKRDLNRKQIQKLIEYGLENSENSYKKLSLKFKVFDTKVEYKRFINFLNRHKLQPN